MRFQGFIHLFRTSKLSHAVVLKCSYSTSIQPRVAIVGSGPAGMFACNALLRRTKASIDVFDAAPVPFGLIRYGVAPDHQEVKNCIHGFDKMFESNRERLSLFCNVRVGIDVSFEDLIVNYDAVLLAYGAHRPKRLDIPGADALNVFAGSDFVSWYNGVPKATKPILSVKNVVIVGNGNVALDCARIICNGKNAGLRATDVPIECIEELERSTVENIKIIGRRGPLDISFTVKELREQFKIPHWDTVAEINECQVEGIRKQLAEMTRQKSRLIKVLLDGVKEEKHQRQCRFLFNRIPTRIDKDETGHVNAVHIMNKEKGVEETLECGLLIYSIGYQTIVLDGVPKNSSGMIDMTDPFRVRKIAHDKADVYAVGWCAHGAKGVIVDSQLQSTIVAEEIAKDLDLRHTSAKGVKEILHTRRVPYLDWDQWKQIDKEEQIRGQEKGKMAALESKLLDGPNVGYCSSSDDDNAVEDFKVVNDADVHEANFMNRIGATSNTGPKGVMEDFKKFKEQEAINKKKRDNKILREARRGLLEGPGESTHSSSDEEETLESLRQKRLAELRKVAKGRVIEIQNKEQFLNLTENSMSGLVGVLIYEPNKEDCAMMTNLFKILAAEYAMVKFARVTSSILGMSEQYRANGVPTLQFYSGGGNLVGNFIKITDEIGIDSSVQKLKNFLKKNHISLARSIVLSNTSSSSDEE